ncbi:MAG TPA: DMT family transporter [Acetobacteraceae bacterium]|nr:DMT family transporter [Acetobacteraceae bacterium]
MNVTTSAPPPRQAKLVGMACLAVTALGWGLNWPATKVLLQQCPPLTARGIAGIAASMVLACVAASRGEMLAIPRPYRARLIRAALLNVTAWMGLTTLSMLWLKAGEAATLAYTMPVWTALIAWPVLGERLTSRRMAALVLGVGGVAVLVGSNGFSLGFGDLPGIAIALSAAVLFASGTVLGKRWPIDMGPVALTAWQVGLGCLPLLLASFAIEHADLLAMPWFGWAALAYTAVMSMGICYLTWFAALRRLDAGTAAIGTLLTPIIGVVASALTIGEPLQLPQFASLLLIVGGIVLATQQREWPWRRWLGLDGNARPVAD